MLLLSLLVMLVLDEYKLNSGMINADLGNPGFHFKACSAKRVSLKVELITCISDKMLVVILG